MHYVARSPPGQAAAAVQVVAAVGGRLQPPFPPPPPQRPVVAGVRVARTELLGGRAGQTLYGQQQQQPPQQQHHHRHPMPTLTLTKMPPMSSLQEKFVAFVMCDFTPRHPSELPTTEWASMVKVPRGQRPSSAPAGRAWRLWAARHSERSRPTERPATASGDRASHLYRL